MALATPLEIPSGLVFNTRGFDIGWYQQVSPGGAGFVQTVQRSEPLWWAEYGTPPLNDDRYDQARAFLDRLEGATETFLAYDPRRPMPRAYQSLPITANPWLRTGLSASGNPAVSAVDYNASTLSLQGMQTAAIVTPGDLISFNIGKIWYCYRVTIGGQANSSGVITVSVKPRPNLIPGSATLPAVIRYRQACFQAKIIGGIKEEDSVDSFPRLSFKCFQMIDRS